MRYLALLGLLAVGCGGGADMVGPSASAPPREIVVNVVAGPGTDTPALASALAVVETHFAGRLRFVRDKSGDRVLSLSVSPERLAWADAQHNLPTGTLAAFAVPWTCLCVAEGEIVFVDAATAGHRNTVLHEIGHTFGLGHHKNRGVMGWTDSPEEVYTDEEWARMDAALAADQDTAGGNYFTW